LIAFSDNTTPATVSCLCRCESSKYAVICAPCRVTTLRRASGAAIVGTWVLRPPNEENLANDSHFQARICAFSFDEIRTRDTY
jgi:hypothetical protein